MSDDALADNAWNTPDGKPPADDPSDWRCPRGPIEIYPSPTNRAVPLLKRNPQVCSAAAAILGITNDRRIGAIDIRFGNGLSGDGTGAATATVEILLDASQLYALVAIATDHDIEHPA